MTEAEELNDFAALLPPALLATLKAAPLDDAFMVIHQQRPQLSFLDAVKTLTAFQLYRTSNAFKETVDAPHAAAKDPQPLPTRLPADVVDHVVQVYRTAAADLLCGNRRALEAAILKAYQDDDPARTARCDNLDALYNTRVTLCDLPGAMVVDHVRSMKIAPARSLAERAEEILSAAAVVLGYSSTGGPWVVSRGRADDYALLLSVPGRDSVVLDAATRVEGVGGAFVIDGFRFQAYYE